MPGHDHARTPVTVTTQHAGRPKPGDTFPSLSVPSGSKLDCVRFRILVREPLRGRNVPGHSLLRSMGDFPRTAPWTPSQVPGPRGRYPTRPRRGRAMSRRFVPVALAVMLLAGCAGPSKLAQKSEENLAAGENTRAWELATRALDRDPGNARARAAATAAGNAIARDWEQRIHVLAQSDSIAAARQVLELATFRVQ